MKGYQVFRVSYTLYTKVPEKPGTTRTDIKSDCKVKPLRHSDKTTFEQSQRWSSISETKELEMKENDSDHLVNNTDRFPYCYEVTVASN